jgi:hypothetical protein
MNQDKYQTMVEKIADSLRHAGADTELIYKISESLKEHRPDKSKRFAEVRFLESCGLK